MAGFADRGRRRAWRPRGGGAGRLHGRVRPPAAEYQPPSASRRDYTLHSDRGSCSTSTFARVRSSGRRARATRVVTELGVGGPRQAERPIAVKPGAESVRPSSARRGRASSRQRRAPFRALATGCSARERTGPGSLLEREAFGRVLCRRAQAPHERLRRGSKHPRAEVARLGRGRRDRTCPTWTLERARDRWAGSSVGRRGSRPARGSSHRDASVSCCPFGTSRAVRRTSRGELGLEAWRRELDRADRERSLGRGCGPP